MRSPIALWAQLIAAAAIVGFVAYGWTERSALRAALGVEASEARSEGGRRGPRRGGGRGGRADRPAPVITAALVERNDDLTIEIVGTARAARSVSLRVRADGEVIESGLEAGRKARRGDVLLQLDETDAVLTLERAQAQLEAANRTLDRLRRLDQANAVTGAALDDAVTAARLAEIDVRRAEKERADRRLVAPFDGVIGLPRAELGDWVDSGAEVATLDDRQLLWIEADLPEVYLPRLAVGAQVSARAASAPGVEHLGEIIAIDQRLDPAARTVRVRIALPNEDETLKPGASFALTMELEGKAYPAAPELALQYGREGLYLWRVTEGVAERAPVRLVRRVGGLVLVEAAEGAVAIAVGDPIVVEGTQRLRDGGKVKIVGGPGVEADQ